MIKFVQTIDIMSYTLKKEWYDYFERLDEAEKKSIISLIKTFLKRRNEEGSGNITIMSTMKK
jgi:hypothetical protein